MLQFSRFLEASRRTVLTSSFRLVHHKGAWFNAVVTGQMTCTEVLKSHSKLKSKLHISPKYHVYLTHDQSKNEYHSDWGESWDTAVQEGRHINKLNQSKVGPISVKIRG